jgi:plastocyanin
MRPPRLPLLVLTLACALLTAPPAMAGDWTVEVTDFEFTPTERRIEVGDKVIWRFHEGGHTTTSRAGQAEGWDSDYRSGGDVYEHVFTKPGRYTYVCTPHDSFMTGVIQVGDEPAVQALEGFRTQRRGKSVTVSFTLNEAARVSYRLRGPSRRNVKRGRLEPGRHRFKLRRLARGRYRGALKAVDDFGTTITRRKSFVIR